VPALFLRVYWNTASCKKTATQQHSGIWCDPKCNVLHVRQR
jgi:hypothetical protein